MNQYLRVVAWVAGVWLVGYGLFGMTVGTWKEGDGKWQIYRYTEPFRAWKATVIGSLGNWVEFSDSQVKNWEWFRSYELPREYDYIPERGQLMRDFNQVNSSYEQFLIECENRHLSKMVHPLLWKQRPNMTEFLVYEGDRVPGKSYSIATSCDWTAWIAAMFMSYMIVWAVVCFELLGDSAKVTTQQRDPTSTRSSTSRHKD